MNTKWMKAVDSINKRKFTVPPGWETREQVAVSLKCAPDRVHAILKPGLEEGAFESCVFNVWDDDRRLTVRVTCYRIVERDDQPAPARSAKPGKHAAVSMEDRIAAAIARHPEHTNNGIAKLFRGILAADVAKVRAGMGR